MPYLRTYNSTSNSQIYTSANMHVFEYTFIFATELELESGDMSWKNRASQRSLKGVGDATQAFVDGMSWLFGIFSSGENWIGTSGIIKTYNIQ